MNIKNFYMITIMTLIQMVSFESISSGEVPNFNEKGKILENSIRTCPPWPARYRKLENAVSQDLVITARHRGDFDKETPENSLGAFLNSYKRCRLSVETDLRLTKDGEVILFHDLNVGKMTNPNYEPETNKGDNKELKELTFSELKNLHLVTINRKQKTDKLDDTNT